MIEYLCFLHVIYSDILFVCYFIFQTGHSVKSTDSDKQLLLNFLCTQHTSKN